MGERKRVVQPVDAERASSYHRALRFGSCTLLFETVDARHRQAFQRFGSGCPSSGGLPTYFGLRDFGVMSLVFWQRLFR